VAAPPAQVQAIVDKLVAFVKKNGIQFEVRSATGSSQAAASLHARGCSNGVVFLRSRKGGNSTVAAGGPIGLSSVTLHLLCVAQ
jgi:hypothetical protein